jgi:hypothetical protein
MASGTGIVASSGQFAVDGVLEDLDTLGAASADGEFIVATGPGAFAYESGNTARTSLGLGTGDSPQFTNLTLSGDLTVNGSTTTIDTTNLLVEDPLVVLAKNQTGSAALDQGFVFSRSGDNQAMIWDESADEFAFIATSEDGTTSGDVTVSSYAGLHVGAMDIDGAMDVAGASVLNGTLQLAGVADAAADVSADSFYFLDGDNLVKSESMADYAASIAGDGLAASSGVLAVDLNEVSAAVVDVAADSFVFVDATDNSTKKESWADYATAIAGNGLAASSGVLAMDISEYSDVAVASGDKFLMLDSDGSTHQLESIDDISTFQAGDGLAASSGVLSVQVSGAAVIASDYVGISGSIAGAGLAYAGGVNSISALSVNVDDSGIEINSDTLRLKDLGVTTAKLAADAVTGAKVADDAIDSEHIADGAIDLAHMSANSVDSDQYVDGSIDRVHLSADVIDGTKIEDDAVDSEHIAAGAIDLEHMSANSVDSDQYVDGSIDTVHLADDAVTAAKLASDIAGSGVTFTNGVLSISQVQQVFASQSDGTTSLALTGGTPAGDVFVFMNGLLLAEGASNDYTISGTTITLSAANAMQTADEVVVKYIVD